MKFFWQQKEDGAVPSRASAPPPPARDAGAAAGPEHERHCPSLKRALGPAFRDDARPRILDLGPFCGSTATWLAARGARVTCEEFDHGPFNAAPPADADDAAAEPVLRLDAADGTFDLVLAWEQIDFVHPARLTAFGAELGRVLADGGTILFFARNSRPGAAAEETDAPARFRIVAEDLLGVADAGWGPRTRYAHPTRSVEAAVAALDVGGIHLQRDQTREFLVKKPAAH